MAVPGSPLDPRAQGCNGLIREGATLIQNAADVMEAIGPMGAGPFRQPATSFDSAPVSADASKQERQDALQLLSLTPTPVAELILRSGLPLARSAQHTPALK